MNFSQRLKELRIRHGLTQKQLAQIADCSQSAISQWERKQRVPYISIVIIFADYFNESTDYLLGLTD